MAVSSLISYVIYTPDGAQTSFSFPYYLYSISDLQVINKDGTEYGLVTDFFLSESPDAFGSYPSGVTINFHFAPPAVDLLIQRRTSKVQDIEFTDNGPFTAAAVNHALDHLVLMIQDTQPGIFASGSFKGMAFAPPTGITQLYVNGDWFKNADLRTTPAENQPWGWVCVGAGTPGSWVAFGGIVEP